MSSRILVICGLTATGKTALGLKLAKKFNGEIISADSRQVYKGMDIGTGKDFKGAWLLDVVKPNQEFSVVQYVELAWKVIEGIWGRGKLPIIVGGTGFYIKGVIDGIETIGVSPDWELRNKLSNLEIEKLREILERTCPERLRGMNESDRRNPRRLIRAIEIAQSRSTSEVSPRRRRGPSTSEVKVKSTFFIGLTVPYKTLYQRIDRRVEKRVRQGVEKEIKGLLKMGYSWENSVLGTTIGYREWREYMKHKTWNMEQKKETIQRWKFAEHGYARRQLTWFKKDPRIHWFDVTTSNFEEKIEKAVGKWYNEP